MFKYLSLIFLFSACCQREDFDKQKAEKALLKILELQRTAHFQKDASLFVQNFQDTSWMMNKGIITQFIRQKDAQRFSDYFGAVDFIKWDGVKDPVLNFSNDGSLAYALVQKQVILKNRSTFKVDTVDYAWLSLYRRYGNQWLLEGNVSTNK